MEGRARTARCDSRTECRSAGQAAERPPTNGTAGIRALVPVSSLRETEVFVRRRDEDSSSVIERAFVEVEALVMMRMHDAAFLVACADEEERSRGGLLIRREILTAHVGNGFDECVFAHRTAHGTSQQIGRA